MEGTTAAAPAAPPASEPAETPRRPGRRERKRLSRRLNDLHALRDLQLLDLGGFVLELYRYGRQRDDGVRAKLEQLIALGRERSELERLLGSERTTREIPHPSVRECPRCATLYGTSDSRFCRHCGLELTGGSEGTGSRGAQAEDQPGAAATSAPASAPTPAISDVTPAAPPASAATPPPAPPAPQPPAPPAPQPPARMSPPTPASPTPGFGPTAAPSPPQPVFHPPAPGGESHPPPGASAPSASTTAAQTPPGTWLPPGSPPRSSDAGSQPARGASSADWVPEELDREPPAPASTTQPASASQQPATVWQPAQPSAYESAMGTVDASPPQAPEAGPDVPADNREPR